MNIKFKFYFIKINYIYYKINIYIYINIKNKEFNILNLKYIFGLKYLILFDSALDFIQHPFTIPHFSRFQIKKIY